MKAIGCSTAFFCLTILLSCGKSEPAAGSYVRLVATFTNSGNGVLEPVVDAGLFLFIVPDGETTSEWAFEPETNSYARSGKAGLKPSYTLKTDKDGRVEFSIPDNTSFKYVCKMSTASGQWLEGQFNTKGQSVSIGECFELPRVPMYYQYLKDGNGTGRGVMMVYVNLGDDTYLGHRIARFTDPADAVYVDYFRYNGSYLYEFDGAAMTKGIVVLTDPESEFVFLRNGRIDYSGGFHGDEMMTDIRFFADGADITDLDRDTGLTECSDFYYLEQSTMHEAPMGTTASPQPIAGHPVECDHTKRTEIFPFGYVTRNTVTWRQDVPVQVLFGGICCTSRNLTKYAKTDKDMSQWRNLDTYDNTLLGGKGFREYHAYNPDTGLSVFCTSKVTKESGEFSDSEQELYIRDNGNPTFYKKYYRGSLPVNARAGETWETEMRVEISLGLTPSDN